MTSARNPSSSLNDYTCESMVTTRTPRFSNPMLGLHDGSFSAYCRDMLLRGLLLACLSVAVALAAEGGSEATFISGARQLTFEGKRGGEGYFSSDGKALIFQSERE